MATHVALLRGINVGGRNKLSMADLRTLVTSLGHTGVSTYIQSGNVLFSAAEADEAALASGLERAIADASGLKVRVIVVSRAELARIAGANPYPHEPDPRRVHVVFLGAEPDQALLGRIAAARQAAAAAGRRDSVTAAGRALYLHTPDGFGDSELARSVLRITGPAASGTARNWATATRLLSLCEEN